MANEIAIQSPSDIVITKNNNLTFKEQEKFLKEEKIIRAFAEKCAAMDIKSNLPLTEDQLALLKKVHILSINHALSLPEVMADPRKISYTANDELRLALCAILLTHALINHLSKAKYKREFFQEHIEIYTNAEGTEKHIDFVEIEGKIVSAAIHEEIVYDWMVYRAPGGRGIKALSDEKTFSQGLENFYRGFSPVSEFSRFERKLFEHRQKKMLEQRENSQQAFRNTIVQQVAQEAAKQLLQQKDPVELAKMLFATKDYDMAINQLLDNQQFNLGLEELTQTPLNSLQIEDKSKEIPEKAHSGKFDEISMDEVLTHMKMRDRSKERTR